MPHFQKGVSGNPKGKKPGTLNKRTELAKRIESHADALIDKVVELALSGDSVALRLCIERLVPKATDKSVTVIMPDLTEEEPTQIVPALLKSLSGQELNISEIKALLDIFNEHDQGVEEKNKTYEKLELNTTDPIEAAKVYARFMQRS